MAVLRDIVTLNLLLFQISRLVINNIRTKRVNIVIFLLLIISKIHDVKMVQHMPVSRQRFSPDDVLFVL